LTFEEVLEVLTEACSHDTRTHTHPTIPFDPDSTPKQTWDAMIMLFLLYTTFSVPYQLAFGGGPDITEAVTATLAAPSPSTRLSAPLARPLPVKREEATRY
ncbi:MAG: hypothetical protein ACPIOQ_59940, partial [Promethearchaeia archaeon]